MNNNMNFYGEAFFQPAFTGTFAPELPPPFLYHHLYETAHGPQPPYVTEGQESEKTDERKEELTEKTRIQINCYCEGCDGKMVSLATKARHTKRARMHKPNEEPTASKQGDFDYNISIYATSKWLAILKH